MAEEVSFGSRIYIDYSDFKTGINEANRLIKLSEQQFKTSAEGMDDWTKSSEGLNAKLKSLSSIIQIQTQKVAQMESEYESIKNQYGENSREAQQWALKLEKERTALAKSEKEQRKYSQALAEVEADSKKTTKGLFGFTKSVKENADATEEATKGAEGLGASFKSLVGAGLVTNAISGLAGALGGLVSSFFEASEATKEYRMNMAKVEQTAKSMGESFDNAKENMINMASVSGDIEATGEAMNNLLASGIKGDNLDKISKQLTGASIKWKDTLKLEGLADGLQETLATNNAIGPFAELLERGGQNLESFNAKLKNCTTEAEKQNLVMATLSEMGLEGIADGYYKANKNMIEAEKAQLKYNDTMAKVGEVMEPVNTVFTNLKTEMISSFLPAIKSVAKGFVDMSNGVKGATKTMLQGFGSAISTLGQRFFSFGKEIVTSIVGIIPELMSKLSQAFPILISLVGDYINLGLLTAKNLFAKVSDFVPSFFSSLLSSFQSGFTAMIDSVPSLFENLFSTMGEYVSMVAIVGQEIFSTLGEGVSFGVTAIREKLPEIVKAITSGLKSFLPQVVDGATLLFYGLLEGLGKILVSLKDNLPHIINTIINAIKEWLPILAENAFNLFKNIVTGLIKFIPVLVENLPSIIKAIVEGLWKLAKTLIDLGKDLLSWIWDGIKGALSWLKDKATGIVTTIKDAITSKIDDLKSVGKDLLNGLWQGILEKKDWLIDKVKGIGSSVVNGFKDIFQIHSPSKVMQEQGANLDRGLARGMENNQGVINSATETLGRNTIDGLKQSIAMKEQELAEIFGLTIKNATDTAKDEVESGAGLLTDSFNSTFSEDAGENTGFATGLKDSLFQGLEDVFSSQNLSSILNGDWSGFVSSCSNMLSNTLSSALTTALGTSFGPIGAIIGNLAGGIVSAIFNSFKKESNKKNLETKTKNDYAYSFYDDRLAGLSGALSSTSSAIQNDRDRVTQIINFNQTNTSPKALSTAEIYRQTNKAVNLLGVKNYV